MLKHNRHPALFFRYLGLLLLVGTLPCARADEQMAVVASHNSPLSAMSKEEAATVFMGLTRSAHGVNGITALDQPDGPQREQFYLKLVDKSPNRMRAYWSRLVFTGKAQPPAVINATELPAQLQADSHAISYLPVTQVDASLKILTILP